MVRAAKRPNPAENRLDRLAGHRVHDRRLDRLRLGERRQYGRQPRREHGLARPGRSGHQHSVTARRRDLQRALRHVVTGDVPEVQRRRRSRRHAGSGLGERTRMESGERCRASPHQAVERDEPLFSRRAHEVHAQPSRAERIGEQPRHRPDGPLQRQLSHEQLPLHRTRVQLSGCAQYAGRDGKIESRSRLAQRAGRQVHHHPARRHVEAARTQRRLHALARFLHRRVGHADDGHARYPVRNDHFDIDGNGLHTSQRRRLHDALASHAHSVPNALM